MNLIPKMVRLPLGRTLLGVVLLYAVTGNHLLGQIKVNNVHPATDKQFNQSGEMEDPREITIRVGTRMYNLAGRERDISTVGGKHWNFSTDKGSGGFFTPPKGEITGVGKDGSGWYINYKPYRYVVGEDQFIYDVLLSDGTELNCSTSIEFPLSVQREPFLLKDNTRYSSSQEYAKGSEINISFEENQKVAFTFTLFDPEPQIDDELEAYLLAGSKASVTIENIEYYDGVELVEANLTFELKSDNGVMNGSFANGLNGFV